MTVTDRLGGRDGDVNIVYAVVKPERPPPIITIC
jgi:hypothetical protein